MVALDLRHLSLRIDLYKLRVLIGSDDKKVFSLQKTVQILYPALRRVLTDLGITQTNEIAIRFIFHCSHMLERLIRGDVLRYDGLKSFVSQNLEVMNVLEREMRYPEEMFGVVIPSSELAYLAELLLPYRN